MKMLLKKGLFFVFVYLLCFVLVDSQFLNPFFPFGIAIVLCVFFGGLIIGFFITVITKSTRKLFLTLSLISLLAILSSVLLEEKQFQTTLNSADLIIDKLEKFKTERGNYPDSLNELTPNYLEFIPKNGFGNDFYYARLESDTSDFYQLKYYSKMGVVATYQNTDKKWSYED